MSTTELDTKTVEHLQHLLHGVTTLSSQYRDEEGFPVSDSLNAMTTEALAEKAQELIAEIEQALVREDVHQYAQQND